MFDTDIIANFSLASAACIPVVVALVQVFKMTGWVQDKYAPLLSIGVGIGVAFLLAHETNDLSANVLSGILFGLAASGLYSGVRSTTQAITAQRHKDNKYKS
jgi:hypothetical protein